MKHTKLIYIQLTKTLTWHKNMLVNHSINLTVVPITQ